MKINIGDRIGVLGDIHYPDRVDSIDSQMVQYISSLGIRNYIFTGDLTDYEVIEFFRPEQYIVVKGNMDEFISIKIACIDIGSHRMVITHGDIVKPRGDLNVIKSILDRFNGDIFISGHTHIPLLQRLEDRIIFNPGSFSFTETFGIIELKDQEINIQLRHRDRVQSQLTIPY
ncbi:MAG: YfcE family phosphodiesterase [Candidatus Micrarchaeota archaeon]|nr:YfcE family phosphodiesterase [Candidatus Micrarchaeota archaeon]MCX8154533.1 YfcE family phosphodiesterase [Candidatus Micrarchaeota archaeon]